jgi:hypothetical protein
VGGRHASGDPERAAAWRGQAPHLAGGIPRAVTTCQPRPIQPTRPGPPGLPGPGSTGPLGCSSRLFAEYGMSTRPPWLHSRCPRALGLPCTSPCTPRAARVHDDTHDQETGRPDGGRSPGGPTRTSSRRQRGCTQSRHPPRSGVTSAPRSSSSTISRAAGSGSGVPFRPGPRREATPQGPREPRTFPAAPLERGHAPAAARLQGLGRPYRGITPGQTPCQSGREVRAVPQRWAFPRRSRREPVAVVGPAFGDASTTHPQHRAVPGDIGLADYPACAAT